MQLFLTQTLLQGGANNSDGLRIQGPEVTSL